MLWHHHRMSYEAELDRQGFVIVPGALGRLSLPKLSGVYDFRLRTAASTDVKEGSTSTRVSNISGDPILARLTELDVLLHFASAILGTTFELSSFHMRTVRPCAAEQSLHVDVPAYEAPWPLASFIFMIDAFTPKNGATRFVPRSLGQTISPETSAAVPACGGAGSLIVFNGSLWHGHGQNYTRLPRRSLQGAFVRSQRPGEQHQVSL